MLVIGGRPVAWLLKKTFFRGPTTAFVMELPTYKMAESCSGLSSRMGNAVKRLWFGRAA